MSLFEDKAVHSKVIQLWEQVFQASNQLIVQSKLYGFSEIGVIPDPDIHQMLVALRGTESLMNVIIDSEIFNELDFDITRMLINAREQLRGMQGVALALKADDRQAYEDAIAKIESQATF